MAPCSCADDLPVVARGRFVEVATARAEPICAGTVAHIDRILEAGFEAIGEVPPERVFVRYEWTDDDRGAAAAGRRGDRILVRAPVLIHEHELAHAVHLQAWPDSARFMHEGLAMLLDPVRFRYEPLRGSELTRSRLDEVLGDPVLDDAGYVVGWYLVSQLLRDHGVEGLRAFWHAVPRRASTATIRQAYLDLFGEPIDSLLEPIVHDFEWADEPIFEDRQSCVYTLCTGEAPGWVGGRWVANGPSGCDDDIDAVGIMQPYAIDFRAGAIWRDYVLTLDGFTESVELSDSVMAVVYPCGFECENPWSYPSPYYSDTRDQRLGPGTYRVEIRSEPFTSGEFSPSLPDAIPIQPGKLELRKIE